MGWGKEDNLFAICMIKYCACSCQEELPAAEPTQVPTRSCLCSHTPGGEVTPFPVNNQGLFLPGEKPVTGDPLEQREAEARPQRQRAAQRGLDSSPSGISPLIALPGVIWG